MSVNAIPERDHVAVSKDLLLMAPPWLEFVRSVFYALFGWRRSYTAKLTAHNFGNIAAGGEETTTVSVPGAREGDAVSVTAKTLVTGLGTDGLVSANDVVTVRRFNFSTGAINPAADDFRIVVLQQ